MLICTIHDNAKIMKRHAGIIPLSRDHHFGLLCCWKIRQGIRKGVATERIKSYIEYFWSAHLKKHFSEEESLLLAGRHNDELCSRAVREHHQLQEEIAVLKDDSSEERLLCFADLLDDHIRFEERILFPHLEKTLPEETLATIGKELEALHATPVPDDYPDAFWEK